MQLRTLLLVVALVLEILAAIDTPSPKVNLTATGLAFLVASLLCP